MTEFNIDEILLEASYKSKKGYIDLSLKEDIKHLENVMYSMNFSSKIIVEFIRNLTEKETVSGDISDIKETLADIIEDYNKIMKVFYYFDPNSVGTVSEVVLTQLLNQHSGKKSFPYLAAHVGGGNALTDIALKELDSKNTIQISLKTTLDDESRIGLGYSQDYAREVTWEKYFKSVESVQEFFDKNVDGHTLNDVKNKFGKKFPDLIHFFESRIDNTIYKLSHIAFFWSAINAKKQKDGSKILNGFKFMVGNFSKKKLERTYKDKAIIYTKKFSGKFTSFSWGLKFENQVFLATEQSKNSTKYLNISSNYLRKKFIENKAKTSPDKGKISVKTMEDSDLGKFHIIIANLDLNKDSIKSASMSGDVKKRVIKLLLKNIDKI